MSTNKEFFEAVRLLEKERGIPAEYLMEKIKTAIVNAVKREYGAAENIGRLLARKHYYFVPFGQDDPHNKPRSIIADFDKLNLTIISALNGVQLQPILI